MSRAGRGLVAAGLALGLAAGALVVVRGSAVPAPGAVAPDARPLPATSRALAVGGRTRSWTELAPAVASRGGALVLGLPGLGETGEVLRQASGLDRLATKGVTVAYVEGAQRSWDAGTCCGPAAAQHLDDLAVLRAVAADVGTRRGLDPRRVFLVGHSTGAMMALRAACEEPTRWAGALSVAGAVVVPRCDARGTRLVLWQGERDNVVPVAGRVFPTGGSLPPLAATVAALAGADLTLLRDPAGTHDWPRPTGALVDQAWALLRDARAPG